jgi:hypothetical protein
MAQRQNKQKRIGPETHIARQQGPIRKNAAEPGAGEMLGAITKEDLGRGSDDGAQQNQADRLNRGLLSSGRLLGNGRVQVSLSFEVSLPSRRSMTTWTAMSSCERRGSDAHSAMTRANQLRPLRTLQRPLNSLRGRAS